MLFAKWPEVRPICHSPFGKRRAQAWIVAASLVAGLSATLVRAQTNQSLTGTILDDLTGMPVEAAVARVDGSDISCLTDGTGRFLLQHVPIGRWTLHVQRFGYLDYTSETIELSEGTLPALSMRITPSPIPIPPHSAVHVSASLPQSTVTRRLTREQIERAGHHDLPGALGEIPGVTLHGSPETPGGTRVSIGGASPDRVAILLDGLPLSGGADGAVDLDALPLAAVSAIEVSGGAQSSAGGDAAIGGILNIITQAPPQSNERELRIGAGRFDAYDAGFAGRESIAPFQAQWAAQRRSHGSSFEYPDSDTAATRNGVNSDDWRLYAAISPGRSGRLRLSLFRYSGDIGQPGALQQPTPNALNVCARTRAQAHWQGAWGSFKPGVSGWYELSREHYTSPITYTSDSEMRERFAGLRAVQDLDVPGIASHSEAEVRARRLEGIDRLPPRLDFGTHHRTEWTLRQNVSAHGTWRSHTFSAALGSALDGDRSSRPIYSPRADLSWSAPRAISLRGGWGRSFRRPPLTSLFWKADAFAVGNPDLKPERAEEWDVGLDFRLNPLRADTRYFRRDIEGMIIWQRATATGQYTPLNLDRVESFGREDQVEIGLPSGDCRLRYSHVWNASYDQTGVVNYDGQIIPLLPRHTHDLALDGRVGRVNGRIKGRWVSDRQLRRDNDPGKTIRPYRVFDWFVRTVITRRSPEFALAFHLDNFTNERYDLLERYPAPGRSWSIEATLNF